MTERREYQSLSEAILPPPGPRRWIASVLFLALVVPALWAVGFLVLPLPEGARYGSAAAVLDGRIYVTGGFGRGGPEALVASFRPDAGGWRAESSLRLARGFHGAATLDGRIYVVGGISTATGADLSSVEVFDPTRGVWEEGPGLPRSINRLAIAQGRDAIYAVGGLSMESGDLGSVYVLRTGADAWDSLPPMPTKRHGVSAAISGGTLYVVGGFSEGQVFDRLESLSLDGGSWSVGAPASVPRGFAGLHPIAGTLYLFGGRVRGLRPPTEGFDTATGSWTELERVPRWRSRFASAEMGGRIYLVGGEVWSGACCGRQVFVYDPQRGGWTKM